MTQPQQMFTETGASQVAMPVLAATVMTAVRNVIDLCKQAQQECSDPVVPHLIGRLTRIRSAVAQAWPLSAAVKQQIDLGPFAAKNIEDWNKDLAETLEILDYVLQHDGASIERLSGVIGHADFHPS